MQLHISDRATIIFYMFLFYFIVIFSVAYFFRVQEFETALNAEVIDIKKLRKLVFNGKHWLKKTHYWDFIEQNSNKT